MGRPVPAVVSLLLFALLVSAAAKPPPSISPPCSDHCSGGTLYSSCARAGDLCTCRVSICPDGCDGNACAAPTPLPLPTMTPIIIPTATPSLYPEISNLSVMDITYESASVTWRTSIPGDSTIYIKPESLRGYWEVTLEANERTIGHSLSVSGLRPSTVYLFYVESCSGAYCRKSPLMGFRSGISAIPPDYSWEQTIEETPTPSPTPDEYSEAEAGLGAEFFAPLQQSPVERSGAGAYSVPRAGEVAKTPGAAYFTIAASALLLAVGAVLTSRAGFWRKAR